MKYLKMAATMLMSSPAFARDMPSKMLDSSAGDKEFQVTCAEPEIYE